MSVKYQDWLDLFTAVEATVNSSADLGTAELAVQGALRNGLVKLGEWNPQATYQDKVLERRAGDMSLRLVWHCYDQSHSYRAMRDMNVLSLELWDGEQVTKRVQRRFED